MTFRKGDSINVTCGDRTVDGVIVIASPNNVSLVIAFDAILNGHVGIMPVLLEPDGVYRSIIDGTEVTISKEEQHAQGH